jgi:DNA polymerase III epsilon subunit-like protein
MLEVILDTETTGLSTLENHRIVEIGCIELNNKIPTDKIFHTYLNQRKRIIFMDILMNFYLTKKLFQKYQKLF